MQELISPSQSEVIVAIGTLAAIVIGAIWGWTQRGARGAVIAGLCGALIEPLWQAHKWLTRYDAQSGYFGLQSVWVLVGEVVLFIVLGVVIGGVWNQFTAKNAKGAKQKGEEVFL